MIDSRYCHRPKIENLKSSKTFIKVYRKENARLLPMLSLKLLSNLLPTFVEGSHNMRRTFASDGYLEEKLALPSFATIQVINSNMLYGSVADALLTNYMIIKYI